jgi:hypothetical protein
MPKRPPEAQEKAAPGPADFSRLRRAGAEEALQEHGVDGPAEAQAAVHGDDRDLQPVALGQGGVGVHVDGGEGEAVAGPGPFENGMRLLAQVAALAGVQDHRPAAPAPPS